MDTSQTHDVSRELVNLLSDIRTLTTSELGPMGLAAGNRPAADVDALLSAVAAVEYELARRMDAAARSGALPMPGPGGMPLSRYWSGGWARRLTRTGAFASRFPEVAAPWAAGVITSEHVDSLARRASNLTAEEMSALIEQLDGRWGRHSPESLARFVQRVIRSLHPPPDPAPDEADAYECRTLSFAVLGDTVVVTGTLPRLEGEAVMAAVEAWAETLRTAADHVPAAARRADGLVALVNAAGAAGTLPNRGGLPVALTVTLEHTWAGDATWTTSRGHALTASEQRFTACTASVTPVAVQRRTPRSRGTPPALAARIAGLAATLLDEQIPLAVGRTQRNATPAQRKALAARDRGCVIPGCGVPAEACQAHHVLEWAAGGETALPNLALMCWGHHRQVDLGMWTLDAWDADALADGRQPPDGQPREGVPGDGVWAGNNGSPWTITRTPRSRWRG